MNGAAFRPAAFVLVIVGCFQSGSADEAPKADEAESGLRKAVDFFRREVATEGGYLWQYSADLALREGEGTADDRTIWVQPPGTPTVGRAYLEAYRLTKLPYLLDAAEAAADALIRGQLCSGGWSYRIYFDQRRRRRYAYRADRREPEGRNTTTLDDDTTQSALRFLMELDRELQFRDARIHEAVRYGLNSLLGAQYPNGAWPQRYAEPPDPAKYPVLRADYPKTWSRKYPKPRYSDYYTFNDNAIADTIATMLQAARIYDDARYRAAAEKAGDFILLAQMPEPQPAWAQQYDAQMHPAWARRFEPPAITGGESQGVMRILLTLYRETGKRKYLEPIPRALQYLRRSRLPDGRLARFYELRTNRPLFFTRQYELTYDSSDMPTHYSFIGPSALDAIEKAYRRLAEAPWSPPETDREARKVKIGPPLVRRVRNLLKGLDSRGAWVESGRMKYHKNSDVTSVIRCSTFAENIVVLGRYIAALSPK